MKTKKCSMCGEVKEFNNFTSDKSRKDGLCSYCRECKKIKKQTWVRKNREYIREYEKTYRMPYRKGLRKPRTNVIKDNKEFILNLKQEKGGCEICGYSKYISFLHYHHSNPETKIFNISNPGSRSKDEILQEINKCVLLCPNCHYEQHYLLSRKEY